MSLTLAGAMVCALVVAGCGGILLGDQIHARRTAARLLVLTALARHGPLSSAELAVALGLDDDVAGADRLLKDLSGQGAVSRADGRWWLTGEAPAE